MQKNTLLLWVGVVLALLVMISPWLLGFSGLRLAMWGNVFLGAAVVMVFLWIRFGEGK